LGFGAALVDGGQAVRGEPGQAQQPTDDQKGHRQLAPFRSDYQFFGLGRSSGTHNYFVIAGATTAGATTAAAPGGSMVIKTESSLTLPRNPAGDSKNVLSATDSSLAKDAGSSGFSLVGDSSLAAFADVKLVPSEAGGTKDGSSDKLFGSDALQLSDDELKLMDAGSTAKGKGKPEAPKKSSGSSTS